MEKTRYTLDIEYSSMEDKRDFEKVFDHELLIFQRDIKVWSPTNNLTIQKS